MVRRADNLTTFMCRWSCSLGALTSWNPQDLSWPVMGMLYLFITLFVTCILSKRFNEFVLSFDTCKVEFSSSPIYTDMNSGLM
jgi:hypothetical protein